MRFAEALLTTEGLRYVADHMEIMSAPGRVCLMESRFVTDKALLRRRFDILSEAERMVEGQGDSLDSLLRLFMETRDISTTISGLAGGNTPDDVELFEIKGLAITAGAVKRIVGNSGLGEIEEFRIPDLGEVIRILDPENTGNTHFHIYDAYSRELASKRKELRALQMQDTCEEEKADALTAECLILESAVRERLGELLRPYASRLLEAQKAIGELDVAVAKIRLARQMSLVRPGISEGATAYEGLRYLPVEDRLRESGKAFQPVDIRLEPGVTLVTGANMGGKSITLKSLALAQMMAQFGFHVPAVSASVRPVEAVDASLGDGQSASEGLSSFGAEILKIDRVLRDAAGPEVRLILIDEPARTTNPEEGRAIAAGIIELLQGRPSISVVTSHYGALPCNGRRLKVKGLKDSVGDLTAVGPSALQDYMDYSLEEDTAGRTPREALRIARLLGIAPDFASAVENALTS